MIIESEQKSFVDEMPTENSLMWLNAMQNEMDYLHENETWQLAEAR